MKLSYTFSESLNSTDHSSNNDFNIWTLFLDCISLTFFRLMVFLFSAFSLLKFLGKLFFIANLVTSGIYYRNQYFFCMYILF